MAKPKHRLVETLLLLGAVASLGVAGVWGLLLLTGLLGAWLWGCARPRERWVTGGLCLLALALLAYGVQSVRVASDPMRKTRIIERELGALWHELDGAAEGAATALGDWADALNPRREAFESLIENAGPARQGRPTLLLLDADGSPAAWAGSGLLHDLESETLPAQGRGFRLGFQSATIFSVVRLPDSSGARVVAGRSLDTRSLPVPASVLGEIRWTVFRPGDVVPEGLAAIDVGPGPVIALEERALGRPMSDPWASRARRWGALALSLALLALALPRGFGGDAGQAPVLMAGAAVAAALAARLDSTAAVCLVLATLLAAWSWQSGLSGNRFWWPPPWLRGLAGAAAVAFFVLWVQAPRPELDLGSILSPGLEAFAWRLTAFGLSVSWLALARPTPIRKEDRDRSAAIWGWLAVLLLLGAGAAHDQHPLAPVALVGSGAVAAAAWASRRQRPLSLASGAVLCLLAALLSSVTWEAGFRQNLKHHLNSTVLPGLARPAPAELEHQRQSLERHFSELDLDSLVLPNPAGLDPQDLGIAVWRGSPLAVHGALSAVRATPLGGSPSSFSFGLPLTNEGEVDWTPTRWREVEEPSPAGSVVSSRTRFLHRGRPWAELSYTLLMRPGFRLSRRPIESLAAGLLRGGPGPFRPDPELIKPAIYGLYERSGEAVEAAWPEVELPLEELLASPGTTVRGPEGRATGFAAAGADGIQVLLLPVLGPVAALERVGTHAVAVLMVIGAALLFGWLCGLRAPPTFASLTPILRSYSKRMLLVTSLLLLVPVILMDIFALRVLRGHLETEQRVAGESALQSAQRVLGEYVLALDPGFGVETILDDELLSWLSRVVHHEINLYWGSSVYASSKSELFSAGLLPKRIPGEIYAELAVAGSRRAARVNQAGRTDYLELYAPLTIPGQPIANRRLFLSVPLLAQQVETAAEIASLRRQVLLATTAVVLLLLAVGNRLARGFTAPLMQVVSGTQRIAAGARSLDLEPADKELATLVEAIDQMAARIAEGRQRLVSEKALVERVIDNVNSGVVSVDAEGRVLLINQAARDLLAAEVGDTLSELLEGAERLTPVVEFLRQAGSEARLETVRLLDEEAEWSLVWVPLPGAGEPTALLVVEDMTEVLRGQRLQAWAEMARIIAHEIKNPLTPIRLSAEHMREVRSARPDEFDRVFERCTANILEQVGELQEISREFSVYSRLPKIEMRAGDLGETVRRIVAAYSASDPEAVRLTTEPGLERPPSRFDDRLIGRALRNLIENALRATSNGRGVEVALAYTPHRTSILVLDHGPGVRPDILPRIFDPYFSTHDSGTGLGLAIARRIAEEHGGGIQARNRTEGGLEVELWIPAAA